MTVKATVVDGDHDPSDYILFVRIRLDMCDDSAMPEAKRIIALINRALRRKSVPDYKKEALRALREDLKQKIKEIQR